MYDVIKEEVKNGIITFYVFDDERESKYNTDLKTHTDKDTDQSGKSSPLKYSFTITDKDVINTGLKIFIISTVLKKESFFNTDSNYHFVFADITTPPPQA